MTTRRDLLTGTVAVIAAPLVPVPALAVAPADRLVDLCAEYFRLIAVANNSVTDEELDARCDAVNIVRETMLASRATTLEGILAKIRAAAQAGLSEEDLSGRFSLSALSDLEMMAGRRRVMPADAIPPLFGEWLRFRDEIRGAPDDKAADAAYAKWDATLKRIVETPSATLAGVATKLRLLHQDLDDGDDLQRGLVLSAINDVERLAKGDGA